MGPYPNTSEVQRSFAADTFVAGCSLAVIVDEALSSVCSEAESAASKSRYDRGRHILERIAAWRASLPPYMNVYRSMLPSVTFMM